MKIAIIGGGISGLSLAWYLLKMDNSIDVSIYEAENRLGGKIFTNSAGGYLLESGVNGFLDNRPATIELAGDLGLSPLRSNDAARRRFIYSNRRLQQLPENPISFLRSNLLSIKGRARIGLEFFTPKAQIEDETLSEFATRRLGKEAYEKLIEPMALGIYAGDGEKLSLRSCFPKIYNLESNYGGLIKGMLKMKKSGAGPGGILTSFYSGMQVLVETLAERLKGRIFINHCANSIEKNSNKGYRINFENNISYQVAFNRITALASSSTPQRTEQYASVVSSLPPCSTSERNLVSIDADVVVVATPAHSASHTLKGLDTGFSKQLNKIPYPYLIVAATAFHKDMVKRNINGFGFLIPSKEGRKILGSLWDSSIFPDRAPKDFILIRTMIGGAKASDSVSEMDDKQVKELVLNELSDIIGLKGEPDFTKIYRHDKAMPQYNVGHIGILDSLDNLVSNYKGLYLHGNAYKGIGVNDCIENSLSLAKKIKRLKA